MKLWFAVQSFALRKKVSPRTPSCYRWIGLGETLARVFQGVLLQRLLAELQGREAGTPELCDGAVMLGWSSDKRPEHVQVMLQHLMCEAARANRELYIVLADVRKAFDMFQWSAMREALAAAGVSGPLADAAVQECAGDVVRFLAGGKLTRPVLRTRGGNQGRPDLAVLCRLLIRRVLGPLEEGWRRAGCGVLLPNGRV